MKRGGVLLKFEPEEARQYVMEAVAEVQRLTLQQLAAKMADNGGDFGISAKEAMAMAVIVEEKLGVGEIFSPLDFGSEMTCGNVEGKAATCSPNGCMDPAEDTSVHKFIAITLGKASSVSDG